jgi:uncharacterized protein YndB with AHSA1/START domain
VSTAHVAIDAVPEEVPAAPVQIELVFRLGLPPDEAFDLVSNRLPEWFGAIHSVRWDHSRSTRGSNAPGPCSERVCDFGGKALHEEIVAFEPGRRYACRANMERSQMKMPLYDHLATFDVEADGGDSVITWRQHFRARWFAPAPLVRWQMRDRMMRPAVDSLLARHGGAWLSVR